MQTETKADTEQASQSVEVTVEQNKLDALTVTSQSVAECPDKEALIEVVEVASIEKQSSSEKNLADIL